VALIIKYVFSSDTESFSLNSKKRKQTTTNKFLDYLTLKLPALMFFHYLESDAQHFVKDCLR